MAKTRRINGVVFEEIALPSGETFWGASFVTSGNQNVNLRDLTAPQRQYVAVELDVRALNAAFAGTAEFYADYSRPLEEPGLAPGTP